MYHCRCNKINYMCFTLSCRMCCKDTACVVHSNPDVVLPYRRRLRRVQSIYKGLPNTCSQCATYRYNDGCTSGCCRSCCKKRACPIHLNLSICSCGKMSDERCKLRLCLSCCNDSGCIQHKNRCACRKDYLEQDCIARLCDACCEYPLCFSHCTWCYGARWNMYNDAMISFERALKDCNLFPEDLVEHIFTRYVEERPACHNCRYLCDYDDAKHYCYGCDRLFCISCLIEDDTRYYCKVCY